MWEHIHTHMHSYKVANCSSNQATVHQYSKRIGITVTLSYVHYLTGSCVLSLSLCVYVCVCVCVRAHASMSVCLFVCPSRLVS